MSEVKPITSDGGTMTRDEYTKALQDAAKEIQGDNYVGNNYYDQDAWDVAFEDGLRTRHSC